MAIQQTKLAGVHSVDPVWAQLRSEAEDIVRREPELATFIYSTILHHDTLEAVVVHRVSERLHHADISGELIRQAYADALDDQPSIGDAFRADDRHGGVDDPARQLLGHLSAVGGPGRKWSCGGSLSGPPGDRLHGGEVVLRPRICLPG